MKTRLFLLASLLVTVFFLQYLSSSSRAAAAYVHRTTMPADELFRLYAQSDVTGSAKTTENASLMFVENVGQFDARARFQVQGDGKTFWLTDDAIWITLSVPTDATDIAEPSVHGTGSTEEDSARSTINLKLSFVGANPAVRLESYGRLDTDISYFLGSDQNSWRASVPVWGGVRYADLYPGIDLELSAVSGQFTPRFACKADCQRALENISIRVEGISDLSTSGSSLYITARTTVTEQPPIQVLSFDAASLSLLVVDPTVINLDIDESSASISGEGPLAAELESGFQLGYGTFVGGSSSDDSYGIAVDEQGSAYVVGETWSTNFPVTPGVVDTTYNGGNGDVAVFKLNPSGSSLVYATYLGGAQNDRGYAIAVNSAGEAIITGLTGSSAFPTTVGAFDRSYGGDINDAFLAKLSASGSQLVYSTFIGGSGTESGRALALDGAGNVLVAGSTNSSNFPTTPGAYDTTYGGGTCSTSPYPYPCTDAFLIKLNANATGMLYGTFLGADSNDTIRSIALASDFSVVMTGDTTSSNFPTTPDAFDTTYGGGMCDAYSRCMDAFVASLSASGSSLLYSTFLGGNSHDAGTGIAATETGVVVTGYSRSADFPVTVGGGNNGLDDIFVVKVDLTSGSLLYATLIGGDRSDYGWGIVPADGGGVWVTGETGSEDFVVTSDAFDPTCGSDGTCNFTGVSYATDIFLIGLDPSGTVYYGTYVGGAGGEYARALVRGNLGNIYLAGHTGSADFPTSPDAFDTTHNGNWDSFVVKLTLEAGFRPDPDGYQFCNGPTDRDCDHGWGYYPNEPARSDFTAEDMSDMFGAQTVCISVIGPCILKPSARLWYGLVHEAMRDKGHCLGMAVTSQRRYEDPDLRHTTYGLTLSEARRAIAYDFVKQAAYPVGAYKVLQSLTSTPTATLQDLHDALSVDEYPTLSLVSRDGQRAHAVTPYAIEDIGGGVWHVQVYDNNYPGNTERYIVINTISNTWSYSGYEGDGDSHSLYILPLYLFDLPQFPPFSWPLYPLVAQADEQPSAHLWLQGGGRLLISDSEGRRLGYLGTALVNEIPGAGYSPILGGLDVDSEPLYTLPLTETYTILLDGQTMVQMTRADLVQFGPGYAAAVQNATVSPTTRDLVSVAGDGTGISFEASGANEVDLVLALDEEVVSHQFKIRGADVDTGDTSTLSVDLQEGVVTFDGSLNSAGVYDLFLTRANAGGQYDFFHRGLNIAAGDTHLIQYQAWNGAGSVEVQIDHGSDGTVDETVELENQPQGILFLPVIRQR